MLQMMETKFPLGDLVITRNALDFCVANGINFLAYLLRHTHADWGDLDPEDRQANDRALKEGTRLFSSYQLPRGMGKLWIITEWDRSVTTILLPEDY